MALLAPLTNMLCRHEFYWSERHHAERCRRCGLLRDGDEDELGSDESEPESGASARGAASFERMDAVDWRRPRMGTSAASNGGASGNSVVNLRQQTEARRKSLLGLIEAVTMGESLTQEDLLDLAMGLIEDGHSAEPQVFGPQAAEHFAVLNEARHGK